MKLRDYQQAAVDAVFAYWGRAPAGSSPLIVMPTGSGKSPTLGEIVRLLVEDYGCRVVVATHRRELIMQDTKAVRSVYPQAQIGIVSASVGRKEWGHPITIGGIQTMINKPLALGHVDVLIVDEAHLISPIDGTSYQSLIKSLRERNPDMRLVGLTATPFRLGQGYLTEGAEALFTSIAYSVDVKKLIVDGWLSNVITGYATASIDLKGVGTRMGEFAANDLELASDVDKINGAVAIDIKTALDSGRTSALVFGTSVAHAKRIANATRMLGISTEVIVGETPPGERDVIIAGFKARRVQCIASCDVLTTGFDAPVVDVIALVRPTMSPSLYVQMVGRGMRTTEGKPDCLLLDYGGNIARHGPIDEVKVRARPAGDGDAPVKLCPDCFACCAASARVCDHCGYAFPDVVRKANKDASALPALSVPIPKAEPQTHVVGRVEWHKHNKRNAPEGTPSTLRIDYFPVGEYAASPCAREWICLDHQEGSFPWDKAFSWWHQHVDAPVPDSVDAAIVLLNDGCMRPVKTVTTLVVKDFDTVIHIEHGPVREPGDDVDDDLKEPACVSCHRQTEQDCEVVYKIDSQGRKLFYERCPHCRQRFTLWLPHSDHLEATAVDENAFNDQEDLPW